MHVQNEILVAFTLLLVGTYHHTGWTFPIEAHQRRKYTTGTKVLPGADI